MNLPDAVARALDTMPTPVLAAVADAIASGRPLGTLDAQSHDLPELLAAVGQMPSEQSAAWLRGAIAGYQHGLATQQVEVVWSGPATAAVPVRSTAQALTDVISTAERELLLMTYSARPYEPLLVALFAAHARSVTINIVIETLAGAGSALSGREPAAAFAEIPGVHLWHWPREQRPTESAKMHAKLAVADRRIMLVSSVNLTESGVENSIEAGVIIRGGHTPQRFVEHVDQLRTAGVLRSLD